jgi:hypothetical protein
MQQKEQLHRNNIRKNLVYYSMAKTKSSTSVVKKFIKKAKVKRPGVHSKKKTSGLKTSKNYKKLYNRQGK